MRFLLLHSLIIQPGLETSDPTAAIERYSGVLAARGFSLRGRRVLVFGYGGRFDLGVGLLAAGAGHVVLVEKFAPPDDAHNAGLLPKYGAYLSLQDGRPRPNPAHMTLLQADIRSVGPAELAPVDLVLSNSVFEHVDDVDGVARALAALTKPDGQQIHFVDLRDHFFKYPFEMLCYSEAAWRGWLNPSSNHNRLRLPDYRRIFEKYFEGVEIDVLGRDKQAFEKARPRIRPEFISGDPQSDSVTLILLAASRPRLG